MTAAATAPKGASEFSTQPRIDMVRFKADGDTTMIDALHFLPEVPTERAMILIPGLNGSIMGAGRHDYRPMANALAEAGFAFLLPQLRALDNFPYAVFEDVVKDIGGVVAFAKAQGYREIALFGTSLGGPRIALWFARRGDPAIRAAGFIASIISPYDEFQIRQPEGERRRLDQVLADARRHVAEGRPLTPVAFENWFPGRHMMMAAHSFLGFFGTGSECEAVSVRHAPAIRVPTLVLHGTAEEISLGPNAEAIHASLVNAPSRDLVWVEGAKHYLTPGWIADAFARETAGWLARTLPAQAR